VRLTTLPPSSAVVMKSGNLNFLEPSGPLQACNGTALPYWDTEGLSFRFRGCVLGVILSLLINGALNCCLYDSGSNDFGALVK